MYPHLDQLLNLPALAGGLLLIASHVLIGLVIYLASHRFLFAGQQDTLGDATRTMFLAVNLLFGLFLSLTLNDVVDDLSDIRESVEREAIAISDVFNGIARFDEQGAREVQNKLVIYTQALIEKDWPSLADDSLNDEVSDMLRIITSSAFALEADSQTETRTWNRISADLDLLSDYRLARLQHALAPPPFFLLVAVFGMVVVMVCMGLYPPSRTLLFLVSFYLAFVGLVIYLILALSDPFQGVPGVDPAPLQYILEQMRIALPGDTWQSGI